MLAHTVALPPSAAAPDAARPTRERQRELVERHHGFVSRVLWSQGTPRAHLDDALQQVFIVALRQLDAIRDERAFLFGVASRVARETARSARRHASLAEPDAADREISPEPSGEELLDRKRAKELLDEAIASLPEDARVVFVLYEIEGMTLEEIAALIDAPRGTVSSRLRRGRELFERATKRMRARFGKGSP
jgi:RNA polymerase sigma-70 factor, ECF subfamily